MWLMVIYVLFQKDLNDKELAGGPAAMLCSRREKWMKRESAACCQGCRKRRSLQCVDAQEDLSASLSKVTGAPPEPTHALPSPLENPASVIFCHLSKAALRLAHFLCQVPQNSQRSLEGEWKLHLIKRVEGNSNGVRGRKLGQVLHKLISWKEEISFCHFWAAFWICIDNPVAKAFKFEQHCFFSMSLSSD